MMRRRALCWAATIVSLYFPSQLHAVTIDDAKAAVARNDLPGATALLRTRVAAFPEDQDSRLLLARVLAWQKEFSEAERLIGELLASSPDDADYLLLRAQVLFWQDRVVDALTFASHARSVAPAYRDAWDLEFKLRAAIGKEQVPPVALAAEFQQRFPAQPLPWPTPWETLEVAEMAIKKEDFVLATVALREYLSKSQKDGDVRLKLARVLAWRQDFTAARAELVPLLRDSPDNADALLLQAQILSWQGDVEQALPVVERALRIAPDYYDIWALAFSLHAEHSDDTAPPMALVTGFQRQFGQRPIPWRKEAPKRDDVIVGSMLYEKLVNSPSTWVDSALVWRTSEAFRRSFNVEWRSVQRYGLSDSALTMETELNLNKRWRFSLLTGGAQSQLLLPSMIAGGSLSWQASDAHGLEVAYRFAAYAFSGTDTTRLVYRWSHSKLGVTVTSINTVINTQDYAGAGGIRVDYRLRPDHTLSYAVTVGDEADVTESGRLVRTGVRAQNLGWRHTMNKGFDVVAGIAYTSTSIQATRGGGFLGFSFHY